jgi:hypothetical protein
MCLKKHLYKAPEIKKNFSGGKAADHSNEKVARKNISALV